MPATEGPSDFSVSDYVTLFFELFERSSDAVLLARADDGVILAANDAFLSLFSLTQSEVIGHTTTELGIWVNPAERTPAFEQARSGQIRLARFRLRTIWSEEFTFELSAVRVLWRGQDAVLGVGHVVTS